MSYTVSYPPTPFPSTQLGRLLLSQLCQTIQRNWLVTYCKYSCLCGGGGGRRGDNGPSIALLYQSGKAWAILDKTSWFCFGGWAGGRQWVIVVLLFSEMGILMSILRVGTLNRRCCNSFWQSVIAFIYFYRREKKKKTTTHEISNSKFVTYFGNVLYCYHGYELTINVSNFYRINYGYH